LISLPSILLFNSIFYFLTLPPPPRSTLFPYTTLFRSRAQDRPPQHRSPRDLRCRAGHADRATRRIGSASGRTARSGRAPCEPARSEEHTSELQSRGHLVCRLLLEKKKRGEE